MDDIILWGGTGQAIVVEDFLPALGYRIIAVFDNDRQVASPFKNIPVYHGDSGFEKWLASVTSNNIGFIVTIGGDNGKDRVAIADFLESRLLFPVSAIHPNAYVSPSVEQGNGIQVMAKACINARAVIGDYSIVNTASTIEHECVLGKGVHIGPGTTLAGCATIGENTFIGAGSVVLPRIKIGPNATIGAGSVVTGNIPDNVIAYGAPTKIVKRKKSE
jgi:sugar O-acyltransferase (sialic acid O-acetyltransferase NeuD family)